jgi:fibronectin type 3 domain-containing protein
MHLLSRLLVAATCLSFGALQAVAQYSVTMPYKQVTVKNVNGAAAFDGALTTGAAGQPALPSYTVSFLLPPDADLGSVSASISFTAENELNETYTVAPIPPLRREDGTLEWAKGSVIVDGKDMAVYGKDAFFPADYRGTVSTQQSRQYKIVDIRINPYLYNPLTKRLRAITNGTLKVTFSAMAKASANSSPRSDRVEKMLKLKVVNPAGFDVYGAAPAPNTMRNCITPVAPFGGGKPIPVAKRPSTSLAVASASAPSAASHVSGEGYLIIGTTYIGSHSWGLSDYYNFLVQQGASVTWIDNSTYNPNGTLSTQQIAQSIRSTIKDWFNWCYPATGCSPWYVLLVGDPDTATGDVPMINCGGTPTDFGYADLSDNWQNEQNPWVSVGRIPVYVNETVNDVGNGNLDKYMYRAINYESASGDAVEWRRFLIAAESPVGWSPEADVLGKNLISQLKPFGWSYHRLYDPYSNILQHYLVTNIANSDDLAEHIYAGSTNFVSTWNSETPGLVEWYTHGGQRLANGLLLADSTQYLNDDYPAMVFAASCGTADPQAYNNLGVSTLWGNAISYIGATYDIHAVEPPAELFGNYVACNNTAGDGLYWSKVNDESGYGNEHALQLNLYGCPEVALNLDQTVVSTLPIPQYFDAEPAVWGNPIRLTWSSVPNATKYVIERSQDFSSQAKRVGFAAIATVYSPTTSYADNQIDYCSLYKYRIYAVDANNNWSGYSALDSASTYDAQLGAVPGVPTGLSASAGSNSATLTWGNMPYASSYNLKRSTHPIGPWVTIASTSYTSFVDYNLITGTTYYYVVSAVNQYGQGANSGYISHAVVVNLKTPTLIVVQKDTADARKVGIGWSSNTVHSNDLNYEFQCARKFPDNTYSEPNYFFNLKYGFGQSMPRGWTWANTDTSMEANTNFAFRMRSASVCHNSNTYTDVSSYSAFTNYYDLTTDAGGPVTSVPTSFTATPGPEQIVVKWAYSGDASNLSFEVFSTQSGVAWSIYPTWSASNPAARACTLYVARGKTYKVSMRAVRTPSCTKLCSKFTSVATAVVSSSGLAAATNLTAAPDIYGGPKRGSIFLSWNDNSLANTGYNIYRNTAATGTFTQISSTTNQSQYEDKNLPDGKKYWYQVKAYNGSTLSAASNTAYATTLSNMAVGKTASAQSQSGANTAAKAVDNSTTTRWSSSGGVSQWWMVDLTGSPTAPTKTIAGTEVMWEKSGSYKYKIETSPDKSYWTMAADSTKCKSTAQTQAQNFQYCSYNTRYVKITVTGVPSGSLPSFFEFRVFGE